MIKDKKAIFIKTKNIGDSIILTSAISALPNDFKCVDIVCFSESKPIFEMNPRVRNIFAISREEKVFKKLLIYLDIFLKASREHYDLLAQFSIDWRGAFFARFLDIGISVARNNKRRGWLWKKSFSMIASVASTNRPASEQDVDLLRHIGVFQDAIAPNYQIVIPSKIKNEIKNWLLYELDSINNANLIVIHAASNWKFKEIPIETWSKVINQLMNKGFRIVLSGSAADIETNKKIADLCTQKPILTEKFSLFQTAALLEYANLLISIDTMAIHLASAVNTPVIAIFGPNNDKNWAPWKVPHKIVSLSEFDAPSFGCRPCGLDGCGGSKISYCLKEIKPEMIVNNALKILGIK